MGSARLGSARLGSARLGSARLGSAYNSRGKTLVGCQAFFRVVHNFSPSAPFRPGNRVRKATGPIVLNVVPCRFQKRPMKPAYRDSSMCRKTRTAEIQCGASNMSTSGPSPFPYRLSAPQPARKTQRICPMEQSNLAKCAALSPFDCCRISLKKKGRAQARSW